jgi:hypothetical protein
MLLAVITALCSWLAWQVKFVRDRKAMLESIAASGGSFGNVDPSDPFVDLFPSPPIEQSPHAPPISWIRQQLGDVGVGVIELPPASTGLDRSAVARLFPEADISENRPPFPESELFSQPIDGSAPGGIMPWNNDKTLLNDLPSNEQTIRFDEF